MDTLAWQQIIINGAIVSVVSGVLVMGSLKYNARLWLQDYPKPIQDKVPPLSATEQRQRVVLSIAVLGVMFGSIILTTLQLRSYQAGTISFSVAYLRLFLMLAIINLFDALVLDLFIITLLKPKFVILPGAEGMEYFFNDYRKQLIDFLKGMVFCTVISLPFAALAVL